MFTLISEKLHNTKDIENKNLNGARRGKDIIQQRNKLITEFLIVKKEPEKR